MLHTRNDKESFNRAYNLAKRFKQTEIPQFADTYGWACYQIGKHVEAYKALSYALEKLPNQYIIYYHLGMNELARNNSKAAKANLKTARELSNDSSYISKKDINQILANIDKKAK